jgi:hypothetical protein
MAVLEKSIEDYLIDQVSKAGGYQIKIEKRAHWPDRLVVMPFAGARLVELKKPKNGRLSEGQKMLHNRLAWIGVHVYVLWTKQDVDNFINEHKVV